jgi:hypothetical protein
MVWNLNYCFFIGLYIYKLKFFYQLKYNEELESEKGDCHSLRKRRNLEDREEEQISIKRRHKDGYTTPPSHSVLAEESHARLEENNIFEEDGYDDNVIIDDVNDLCFKDGDPSDDYKIKETNISQLFRNYQNKSVWIAKNGGLLVESNVHEILSLSSIFLLVPNSHSRTMIDIFGSRLLDEIHQNIMPVQNATLNSEYELKFREAIKKTKKSREHATDWFYTELADDRNLRKGLGSLILKYLETLPTEKIKNEPSEITFITNYLDNMMKSLFHDPDKHMVQWPNTALNESKSRKYEGRSKQPDFVVSIIHQLQTDSVIFIGEVSPPSQRSNVYKNCKDLIRLGVFMKDCMDSAIDKGADINVLGFHCVGKQVSIVCFCLTKFLLTTFLPFHYIDYEIDFYTTVLIQGTYFMAHIGKVLVPASIEEILYFVDELEKLLGIQEIFQKSFDTLHDKLCSPSLPSSNAIFKHETLSTPKFNQLVSETRNCHRICPFRFGRF